LPAAKAESRTGRRLHALTKIELATEDDSAQDAHRAIGDATDAFEAVKQPLGGQRTGKIVKPRVYVETSVISYLTARPSNDLRAMANQNATVEWWETQRSKYDLVVSEFVIAEASLGHPDAAKLRLSVADEIATLKVTEEVRLLGKVLITRGALPSNAELDAYHVAVAAVNGVDYLLTWNCKHIANAHMRPKIEAVCKALGYAPPVICTPDELTEI